jgi:Patatin-like phospholipase
MENIALAFSGGGFRAAAYSLGCLSYLSKVKYGNNPLLHNVKFISSTSGGSITNLLYSAYVYEGKTFQECYDFLFKKMDGEELLKNALENLKTTTPDWKERPDKSINLINAFSLEYDKLLEQREFAIFSDRSNNPHLEEICVNSTEFTNGYAFRFQSQHPAPDFPNGEIGNFYINFSGTGGIENAEKIKLADILASSSCFPTGFEPMIFPHDYTTKNLSKDDLKKGLVFNPNNFTLPPDDYNNTDFLEDEQFNEEFRFGIMDGGVADNQAIEAFMLADDRRKDNNKPPFDLFLSCDVSSYFMDGYTLPVPQKKWYDFISLNAVKVFAIAVIGLIAAWLPFSILYFCHSWHWWNSVTAIVSAIFFIPVASWLLKKVKGIFKKKTNKPESSWASVFNSYKNIFTGMGLGKLKLLLLTRAKSMFILTNDVYLKQIRRICYNNLFGDPNYRNRVILNAIYTLSEARKKQRKFPAYPTPPSDAIIAMAEKARTMGTTLWFDKKHQAEKMKEILIATGQFTTCYNLLEYVTKKEKELSVEGKQLSNEDQELKKQLKVDWDTFCKDPIKSV